MFVDHVKVYVKAGDGGRGCVAFRREKFVPRGGPSGGDGGRGGDVVFRATPHLNTLLPFRYRQHFRAQRGGHGSGNRRTGKDGENLVVEVPIGTQVYDESSGKLLADLVQVGQEVIVARGGRGGRGNAAFATPTQQAPRYAEEGRPGEERCLILDLKVLADVGLIGYPNAGKSTMISVLSAAHPKVADYPFTTLTPQLGVMDCGEFRSLVVADIPGLIEGAHAGSGLGDEFLRHVERCRILVHLVDVSAFGPPDPVTAFEKVNEELGLYNPDLLKRLQIVAATKMDVAEKEKVKRLEEYCSSRRLEFLAVSAVSGVGVDSLKRRLGGLCFQETKDLT